MMSDYPTIPSGQPTWCRVRSGGGCSLPRARRKGAVSPAVPTRLKYYGNRRGVEVWTLERWSPGDRVELGPLPPNVVVEYWIARPWTPPLAAGRDAA
ncbi:hypothetical protein [Gordonia jacobaea]|uniref:hypothetical protein n=2 Tax=Gordoniaceae TaxID=85026 RepID=UPI0022E10170|nr:hypothetical protein [Gordonia jacobaea]